MNKQEKSVVSGYKGFDKNMKCRGFQFEEGKTYTEKDAVMCTKGFHFCKNPLDVFTYYPPTDSVFAPVKGSGKTATHAEDSKVVATKLEVGEKITLRDMISAGVKFIFPLATSSRRTKSTTRGRSHAVTTGDRSHAATMGYCSNAITTGDYSDAITTEYCSNAVTTRDYSNAVTTGSRSSTVTTGTGSNAVTMGTGSSAAVNRKEAIACGLGYECKAKALLDGEGGRI